MHAFTSVWPFMCVHCLLCQLACRTQTAKPCCLMLANYGCNPIAVQPFFSSTAVRQHTGSLQHSYPVLLCNSCQPVAYLCCLAGHRCSAAGQCSAGLALQVLAVTAGRVRCSRGCSHSLALSRQLRCSRQADEPSRHGAGHVQHKQAGHRHQQTPPAYDHVVWGLLAADADTQARLHVAATASSC